MHFSSASQTTDVSHWTHAKPHSRCRPSISQRCFPFNTYWVLSPVSVFRAPPPLPHNVHSVRGVLHGVRVLSGTSEGPSDYVSWCLRLHKVNCDFLGGAEPRRECSRSRPSQKRPATQNRLSASQELLRCIKLRPVCLRVGVYILCASATYANHGHKMVEVGCESDTNSSVVARATGGETHMTFRLQRTNGNHGSLSAGQSRRVERRYCARHDAAVLRAGAKLPPAKGADSNKCVERQAMRHSYIGLRCWEANPSLHKSLIAVKKIPTKRPASFTLPVSVENKLRQSTGSTSLEIVRQCVGAYGDAASKLRNLCDTCTVLTRVSPPSSDPCRSPSGSKFRKASHAHVGAGNTFSENISPEERKRLRAAQGLCDPATLLKELVLLFDVGPPPKFCFPDGTPDVSANASVGEICNFVSFTSSLGLGSKELWNWPKPNHTIRAGNSFRKLLEEKEELDEEDDVITSPDTRAYEGEEFEDDEEEEALEAEQEKEDTDNASHPGDEYAVSDDGTMYSSDFYYEEDVDDEEQQEEDRENDSCSRDGYVISVDGSLNSSDSYIGDETLEGCECTKEATTDPDEYEVIEEEFRNQGFRLDNT
uniref:Uncharacterized protein n=1 Tax=Toxoplasma gondii COUG TaxID=1074873 RepID=A0A2G8Y1X0_TOXGO|nr:hypothetical protein TGCOUG_271320 [Toxoplasma gondii COUG]